MALYIHQMKVRNWVNLVLIMLNAGVLKTSGRSLQPINFRIKKNKNTIIQHPVYEIILKDKEKINVKYRTHDNIDDEVDRDELYELDIES